MAASVLNILAHVICPVAPAVSLNVLLAVLFGALLHASWNILVKRHPDKLSATAGVFIGSGVIAALIIPWLPPPAAQAWPYLIASACAEVLYAALLARAYRLGDLSHAYPLMRGTPPLLVAAGSLLFAHERLSSWVFGGVALVCAGILALVLTPVNPGAHGAPQGPATRAALTNACVIATYTMIDGLGIRASGNPLAYILWLFLLTGGAWVAWALFIADRGRRRALRASASLALAGGALSLSSYGIALWAMTRAPIAAVAAVRETSIVFGVMLGGLILKERITRGRALAAGLVTLGVYLIRGHA
jgi:drug/metabolite transporter (DMT)-like permease